MESTSNSVSTAKKDVEMFYNKSQGDQTAEKVISETGGLSANFNRLNPGRSQTAAAAVLCARMLDLRPFSEALPISVQSFLGSGLWLRFVEVFRRRQKRQ